MYIKDFLFDILFLNYVINFAHLLIIFAPTAFLVSQQEISEIQDNTQALILNILPDSNTLNKTTKALKEYIGTFFLLA